jgi:hypothetical protein
MAHLGHAFTNFLDAESGLYNDHDVGRWTALQNVFKLKWQANTVSEALALQSSL